MSIAVAVIVRPSPRSRWLLAIFAGGACAVVWPLAEVALATASGKAWAAAGASAVVGLFFCVRFGLSLTPSRYAVALDISGVGQLRAAVYHNMGVAALAAGAAPSCTLLPGSTLWPGLLLLRLRRADGTVLQLVVWPDSVAAGLFRPLAAACRAIATCHTDD